MKTFEEILQKLKDHFSDGEVNLINTSSQHIGHNNSGMHLKATINHKDFKLIIKKSYPFKIDLSGQQLIDITKKYLLQNYFRKL